MSKTEVLPNNVALTDIAGRINTEHEACHASMKKGLDHALKAGELLLEAKRGLPHGEWLPWLGENCPDISERTAQNYMRLARELPKLEPAKTQRVSDLCYRDAIRVVSQDIGSIAASAPKDQAVMIETLETGGSMHEARRKVKQYGELAVDHVPAALKPEPDKRRVGVLTNGERREVSVVIGPNLAGANLSSILEEMRRGDLYVEWRDQIADLKAKAAGLRKEAEQLEDEARRDETMMNESLALDIEEAHGPVLHYVETWDYALDAEQWAVLQRKQNPEDAAAYVAEVGNLKDRGWWGDVTLAPYSANGPGHEAPAPGWNGWGSSEWLAKVFPDGLAPQDIKSGP